MTGRCKTCLHWKPWPAKATPGLGDCDAAIGQSFDDRDGKVALPGNHRPVAKGAGVAMFYLTTNADFGCTLHPENQGKE